LAQEFWRTNPNAQNHGKHGGAEGTVGLPRYVKKRV
jgi:hypothetical protein